MWTVVYMTKKEDELSSLKSKLQTNKIMVMVRKIDDFFEILVPSEELPEAQTIIIDTKI